MRCCPLPVATGIAIGAGTPASAQDAEPPNSLAIIAQEAAQRSLRAYSLGMQYPTRSLDRIAPEMTLFGDRYAHPIRTAERPASGGGGSCNKRNQTESVRWSGC